MTEPNIDVHSPKAFISYSWSSDDHERWVLKLAEDLVESGVHVIIDKWDLREGHDAHKFMEQMVTDAEIKKVILVSDKVYAAKADGREGGVGTEAQILTPQLYGKREQDKFVAVLPEKDENGKAFLPTYYSSRIYIDLSEPENYSSEFERLIRWIYNKPLYKRPELGKRPAYLDEKENAISLSTSSLYRRAVDALKNERGYANAALREYLDTFSQNLERFRITDFEGEYDDAVIASIEAFMPYRNELIQLFTVVSQYAPSTENFQTIHRFFEKLIPYLNYADNSGSYKKWDFDNFRFIFHELYLYAVTVFIEYDLFEQAADFVDEHFYVGNDYHYGNESMVNIGVLNFHMQSLEYRNQRLQRRRLSMRADLLKERCTNTNVQFYRLMQADFILYIRSELREDRFYSRWWPHTLLYAGRSHRPFEIFARAQSRRYFDRMKILLRAENPSDLESLLESFKDGDRTPPRWEFERVEPARLMNYEQLGQDE